MISAIGFYAVPVILFITAAAILFSKNDLFGEFISGCRNGLSVSMKLLPNLIALMCASRMLAAGGAVSAICSIAEKLTLKIGLPSQVLPIIFMRPISGSTTTALLDELMQKHGADSFAAMCACVIVGSSDTIFYTLSMYFSGAGIKKSRHALPASLLTFAFCVTASVVISYVFFG